MQIMTIALTVTALLMSGAPNVLAQSSVAVLHDPENKGLREVYSDEVPVSGRVIAGVALYGLDFPGEMAVFAQGNDIDEGICVQLMSRDGRYWAENNFRATSSQAKGPVKVEYESRYEDQLSKLQEDDLAILSHPSDCDNEDFGVYLPAALRRGSQKTKQLKVYVNSARADTFVRVTRGEDKKTLKCQRITEGRRTGYDTICEIDLQQIDYNAQMLDLKIYRRKFDRNLAPVSLQVRMPTTISSSNPVSK